MKLTAINVSKTQACIVDTVLVYKPKKPALAGLSVDVNKHV